MKIFFYVRSDPDYILTYMKPSIKLTRQQTCRQILILSDCDIHLIIIKAKMLWKLTFTKYAYLLLMENMHSNNIK